MVWSSNMTAILRSAPRGRAGAITGVFNMIRFTAGIIGTTIVGLVMEARMPRGAFIEHRPVPGYSHSATVMMVVALIGVVLSAGLPASGSARRRKDTAEA